MSQKTFKDKRYALVMYSFEGKPFNVDPMLNKFQVHQVHGAAWRRECIPLYGGFADKRC